MPLKNMSICLGLQFGNNKHDSQVSQVKQIEHLKWTKFRTVYKGRLRPSNFEIECFVCLEIFYIFLLHKK